MHNNNRNTHKKPTRSRKHTSPQSLINLQYYSDRPCGALMFTQHKNFMCWRFVHEFITICVLGDRMIKQTVMDLYSNRACRKRRPCGKWPGSFRPGQELFEVLGPAGHQLLGLLPITAYYTGREVYVRAETNCQFPALLAVRPVTISAHSVFKHQ